MNTTAEELKWLILNSSEPLLIKNVLKSELLNWSLEDWSNVLKDKELDFRSGAFDCTNEPQWERKTNFTKGSFDYFLKEAQSHSSWLYFDYKYLKNWLTDVTDLRKNITWAALGFPDVTADDCTIWIGSKGSHTPCHVDTYGFNLIFQVFGKKLWVISPPEENLKPTRIPYEESSIYSELNFFSPSIDAFKGINDSRKIVLTPGDVLYLPHKWWHYVENLETAISINVWMPSPQDDDERLKESVAQLLVKQMTEVSSKETNNLMLNPNMEELILHGNLGSFFDTLYRCRNICKEKLKGNKRVKREHNRNNTENVESDPDEIIEKYEFIERVPKMPRDQFNLFLEEQRYRFKNHPDDKETCKENDTLELLNVLTDSDVISLISNKLLATKH